MRLTWRDGLATLLVAAATLLFVLWTTGTALAGTSTRAVGAIVLALGFVGCTSDRAEMAGVYGADGRHRAPMGYVVVASVLGTVALVAAVLAVAVGSEAMLATLVGAMIALWTMTTIRHATGSRGRSSVAPIPRL